MKSSNLNRYLKGIFSEDEIKKDIKEEVSSYCKLNEKMGSTNPLYFYEDEEVILNNSTVKRLLQETLSGRLSNIELAYICDCLTLGEKVQFTDERSKEIIFEIADPEINGGYKSDTELIKLILLISSDN